MVAWLTVTFCDRSSSRSARADAPFWSRAGAWRCRPGHAQIWMTGAGCWCLGPSMGGAIGCA